MVRCLMFRFLLQVVLSLWLLGWCLALQHLLVLIRCPRMTKISGFHWVSLFLFLKGIYIYIYIYTRTQLIQMKKLIYDINGICFYICRHLGITDHFNGSEIFEFLEDHASWTHGRSKAGIFYFSFWLFISFIY